VVRILARAGGVHTVRIFRFANVNNTDRKSGAVIEPIHEAQLITYLKLAGVGVGLLINFNVTRFKDGIRRFVR
jgi:hypothetical protein